MTTYDTLLAEIRTSSSADTIAAGFVKAVTAPGIDLEKFRRLVEIDTLVRLAALEAERD